MTTTPLEIPQPPDMDHLVAEAEGEERKRRGLLLVLLLVLLALCAVLFLFIRYLLNPAPLAQILPAAIAQNVHYPPAYKFSISGVEKPLGVAVSPDGQRIYVAEGDGERLIKMFDRDGRLINSFAPPGTLPSNRQPVYLAVDRSGRLFVTDNYNRVIQVFSADGAFLDAIISPDLTLSEFVAERNQGQVPAGTEFFYNNINKHVYYRLPGQEIEAEPVPDRAEWGPMGLRFDGQGNLLVTDFTSGQHRVLIFPAEALEGDWTRFEPVLQSFGEQGAEKGQFSYPNSVVTDRRGNFYVSDGNNARISFWSADRQYRAFFGFGATENALNLPRGQWMDSRDRLHVADAVGQYVRVYDVSGEKPAFLYSFGSFGLSDGRFNYPTDIGMDISGRLYIADRENNRVQVWSY